MTMLRFCSSQNAQFTIPQSFHVLCFVHDSGSNTIIFQVKKKKKKGKRERKVSFMDLCQELDFSAMDTWESSCYQTPSVQCYCSSREQEPARPGRLISIRKSQPRNKPSGISRVPASALLTQSQIQGSCSFDI